MPDKLLLDSSAIIDLCSRRKKDTLLESSTLNLAFYEVGNAIWKQVYIHKALTLDEGETALDALADAIEQIEKIQPTDSLGILKIAVEEGLTYYDAAYLHAAIENQKTLVTNDEKLHRTAKKYVKTMTSDEL